MNLKSWYERYSKCARKRIHQILLKLLFWMKKHRFFFGKHFNVQILPVNFAQILNICPILSIFSNQSWGFILFKFHEVWARVGKRTKVKFSRIFLTLEVSTNLKCVHTKTSWRPFASWRAQIKIWNFELSLKKKSKRKSRT